MLALSNLYRPHIMSLCLRLPHQPLLSRTLPRKTITPLMWTPPEAMAALTTMMTEAGGVDLAAVKVARAANRARDLESLARDPESPARDLEADLGGADREAVTTMMNTAGGVVREAASLARDPGSPARDLASLARDLEADLGGADREAVTTMMSTAGGAVLEAASLARDPGSPARDPASPARDLEADLGGVDREAASLGRDPESPAKDHLAVGLGGAAFNRVTMGTGGATVVTARAAPASLGSQGELKKLARHVPTCVLR